MNQVTISEERFLELIGAEGWKKRFEAGELVAVDRDVYAKISFEAEGFRDLGPRAEAILAHRDEVKSALERVKDDAKLGALVRQMSNGRALHHYPEGWRVTQDLFAGTGMYHSEFLATPEEALRVNFDGRIHVEGDSEEKIGGSQ